MVYFRVLQEKDRMIRTPDRSFILTVGFIFIVEQLAYVTWTNSMNDGYFNADLFT